MKKLLILLLLAAILVRVPHWYKYNWKEKEFIPGVVEKNTLEKRKTTIGEEKETIILKPKKDKDG